MMLFKHQKAEPQVWPASEGCPAIPDVQYVSDLTLPPIENSRVRSFVSTAVSARWIEPSRRWKPFQTVSTSPGLQRTGLKAPGANEMPMCRCEPRVWMNA